MAVTMQVETFEDREVDSGGLFECDAAALELIEQLGLEGQQQLNKRVDGAVSRFPFHEMTTDERFVYGIICPTKRELKHYAAGPIPERVLRIAMEHKDTFRTFHVWSAESAAVPDPVLVGVRQMSDSSWDTKEYLLARWGKELESFPKLLKMACTIFRSQYEVKAKKAIKQLQQSLDDMKGTVDTALAGSRATEPYASVWSI